MSTLPKRAWFLQIVVFFLLLLQGTLVHAQDTEGNFLTDPKSGCTVWFKHTFTEDSVNWSGSCVNGMADGKGKMTGFTKGKQTSVYTGEMKGGKPNGEGEYIFGSERRLKGYFTEGEPLFLSPELRERLKKNIISETDEMELYAGDNNKQQLYYHSLIPDKDIKGVIVLLPGTWETTEHVLSSMSTFCEIAYRQQLAVMVLSINQRITLTPEVVKFMNKMIDHARKKYNLPDRWVIGGFSSGGLFSLRYTEVANEDSAATAIRPMAVFSCDGPTDLTNLYQSFTRKLKKIPGHHEATYGIREMEEYCGGSPETTAAKYEYYSVYSHQRQDGGNAKYLTNTPVRIYADVDPDWWIQNRQVDLYDMNALDQSAMILCLREKGNEKAEFINAFVKGYRIEGNRHPHSWSIVEPQDCINWISASMSSNK